MLYILSLSMYTRSHISIFTCKIFSITHNSLFVNAASFFSFLCMSQPHRGSSTLNTMFLFFIFIHFTKPSVQIVNHHRRALCSQTMNELVLETKKMPGKQFCLITCTVLEKLTKVVDNKIMHVFNYACKFALNSNMRLFLLLCVNSRRVSHA